MYAPFRRKGQTRLGFSRPACRDRFAAPPFPFSEPPMRASPVLVLPILLSVLDAASRPAVAQAAAPVTVTRLECGTPAPPTDVGARFSDTYAYNGLRVQLVFSCYLVRHGDEYMVWDTGQPPTAGATAPKTPLVDLLRQV